MRLRWLAATIVSTVVLGGCAGTTQVKTKADRGGMLTHAPSRASAARLGQTITLKGNGGGEQVAVTAVKVVDPTRSTDGFSTPERGSRYVAVQFRLRNTGSAGYDDSPSNGAKVVDTQGQQFDTTIVGSVNAGPLFPASVKIPAGGSALGYLVFQVPVASKVAKVQFGMSSGFGDTGEWTV